MARQWIGVNTQYLTLETITTTINNEPSTTIKTITAEVATVTSAGGSQSVGDVTIVLPQAFHDALSSSVDAALTACNAAPGKMRRRDDGNIQRRDTRAHSS